METHTTALDTGWTWEDVQQYDSAFDRGAADTFNLRTAIMGWLVGLARPAGPQVFVVRMESELQPHQQLAFRFGG